MGLFDAFTGANAKDAGQNNALWATQLRNSQNEDLKQYAEQGKFEINQGLKGGVSDYISQLGAAINGLGQGYSDGRNDLTNGYGQALSYLAPYAQAGGNAQTMYSNSLGLNGASGNDAAVSAFQASPGYQWQVDQATDAAARKANSLGMAASGNTLSALATLGSNLANQEYGGWQDRLMGLGQQGFQAAQGQANLASQQGQGLAALAQNYGQGTASLYGKSASDLLGANMQAGLGKANVIGNLANNSTSLAGQFMNTATNSNMEGAKAADKGNENMWGAIGGLAKSAFSLF